MRSDDDKRAFWRKWPCHALHTLYFLLMSLRIIDSVSSKTTNALHASHKLPHCSTRTWYPHSGTSSPPQRRQLQERQVHSKRSSLAALTSSHAIDAHSPPSRRRLPGSSPHRNARPHYFTYLTRQRSRRREPARPTTPSSFHWAGTRLSKPSEKRIAKGRFRVSDILESTRPPLVWVGLVWFRLVFLA